MPRHPRRIVRLLTLLPMLASGAGAEMRVGGDLPAYDAAASGAPAVTEANLLENEAFWPFRVSLTREWKPAGSARGPKPGFPGILLRVEPDARLRVDFGRQGAYTVPASATDVVARANQVRSGERRKMGANLVRVVGPHLSASTGRQPRPLDLAEVASHRAFLFVFADPAADGFADLAASLASLPTPAGVAPVLFPQGGHRPEEVMRLLGQSGWTPAFVYSVHAEPLTRSLLEEPRRLPALELQTVEGRSLGSARWSGDDPGQLEGLRAALDAFGAPAPPARETR